MLRVGTRARLAVILATAVLGAHMAVLAPGVLAAEGSPRLVKDIVAGPESSVPDAIAIAPFGIYFSPFTPTLGKELWRSDGTEAGTKLVKNIAPGAESGRPHVISPFGSFNLFAADSVKGGEIQRELWITDGSEAGTTLLKKINPNNASASIGVSFDAGNYALFKANNGVKGVELWKTNGTPGGTEIVKDINPLAGNSEPRAFTALGGFVYFVAEDGTNGDELWRTDGTEGNTTMVKNINEGVGADGFGFGNAPMIKLGNELFFSANDGSGISLWKTDGSEGGTVKVKALGAVSDLTLFNNALYFEGSTGVNDRELWRSDGTEGGTAIVKDIYPGGVNSGMVDGPVVAGGRLFFKGETAAEGEELWVSDGTEAGTHMVKALVPGPEDGLPFIVSLVEAGGNLYFNADDEKTGLELWRSDGTEAGTFAFDIAPGAASSEPSGMIESASTLFFSAETAEKGRELWALDLSLPGTNPTPPPPPPLPDNSFKVGKVKTGKDGSAKLTVTVPGPGVLTAEDATTAKKATASASKGKGKGKGKKPALIKPAKVVAKKAGPVTLTIKPSAAGKKALKQKGKLTVKVKVTFTPTGGKPNSQTTKVKLTVKPKAKGKGKR
ncbi:MAG: hypothetical protein WD827_04465 [Solirubrobacterales bacterium]